MVTVTPLDAPFGAEITDVDLAADQGEAVVRPIIDALHAHRMIVIRDQSMDKDRYLEFGRAFGQPIPHVLDHLRMPGHPEMLAVGNTEEMHKRDEIRNGAAFWHTDQSYEAEPASATMLYAVKVPKAGGGTLIADLAGAYDALDDSMKAQIDCLTVKHYYGASSGRGDEKIASPLINDQQTAMVPPIEHPLVRPHPVTGRKTLYAVAGTTYGIVGMDDAEARALLEELKAHALEDRFVMTHDYRVGDIAIWDTGQTLHRGPDVEVASGEDDARLLYRISVRGKPPIYQ